MQTGYSPYQYLMSFLTADASKDEAHWRFSVWSGSSLWGRASARFLCCGLWYWEMVTLSRVNRRGQAAWLVGRASAKLHPSMPSTGGLFGTASISEVHLDMVQVRTCLDFSYLKVNIAILVSCAVLNLIYLLSVVAQVV